MTRRAVETVTLAFEGSSIPVADVQPYPDGESWRQAVARVGSFLADLPSRWSGHRGRGGRRA